jgi:CheY-like chemotaxis protein
MPSAVFLTRDLVFSSRLAAAGTRLGVAVIVVSSVEAAIARLADDIVKLVVVDLSASDFDINGTVSRLREGQPALRIVAFAPHVHEMRLKAAAEAGCTEVLTRGQFDRQMEELLVRYAVN